MRLAVFTMTHQIQLPGDRHPRGTLIANKPGPRSPGEAYVTDLEWDGAALRVSIEGQPGPMLYVPGLGFGMAAEPTPEERAFAERCQADLARVDARHSAELKAIDNAGRKKR